MNTISPARKQLSTGIYLVIDHDVCGSAQAMVNLARKIVHLPLCAVQLRWKHATSEEFLDLCAQIAPLFATSSSALVLNDALDVYLAAREQGIALDGMHIGQDDGDPAAIRAALGSEALLGLSAAQPAELEQAASWHAAEVIDYVGVGTVHATQTKADAPDPIGIRGITQATTYGIPVVAIGGIGIADIPALASIPVRAVAVVSAICAAQQPVQAAQELIDSWCQHYEDHRDSLIVERADEDGAQRVEEQGAQRVEEQGTQRIGQRGAANNDEQVGK